MWKTGPRINYFRPSFTSVSIFIAMKSPSPSISLLSPISSFHNIDNIYHYQSHCPSPSAFKSKPCEITSTFEPATAVFEATSYLDLSPTTSITSNLTSFEPSVKSALARGYPLFSFEKTIASAAYMLQASLVIPTAKLDISHLLQSSPSPPAPGTNQAPSFSRSTSVSSTRPLYPLVSSPSASTTSQVSTAAASAVSVGAQEPPARSAPPAQAPVSASLGSSSKRPPPLAPHPLATPAKKQSKWSQQENELIINLRGTGMKWEDISRNLPGRSAISCRLHYQNYLERKCEWDEEKKNKLARLYDRMKSDMWAGVARDLGVPWRTAEAMHWILGEQEMARRAGVTPFAMAGTSGIPPSDPSLAGGSNLSRTNQNTSPRGSDRGGPGLEGSSVGGRESDAREREGARRRGRGGGATGSQNQGQGTQLPSLWELEGVGTPFEVSYEEEERGRRYRGSRED